MESGSSCNKAYDRKFSSEEEDEDDENIVNLKKQSSEYKPLLSRPNSNYNTSNIDVSLLDNINENDLKTFIMGKINELNYNELKQTAQYLLGNKMNNLSERDWNLEFQTLLSRVNDDETILDNEEW
jgi:hypothetical protein